MTWFRIDDGFWSHPKVVGLSDGAVATWVRAGTYSCQHLTDGFVAAGALRLVGDKDSAAELVAAGLWEIAAGGWRFHDWAEYQETSETVKERRRQARDRQRKARAARDAKKAAAHPRSGEPQQGQTADVTPPVTEDVTRDNTREFSTPDPTVGRVGTTSLPSLPSVANATEGHSPRPSATTDRAPAPARGGREVAERLNATAHSVEAHTIVREYERHVGVPIPGDVLSGMARRIDECLAAGVGPEQIARGLVAWRESDSWSPSQIPSFVHKAGAKPTRKRGQSKPSVAAEGAVTLAEQMIAEGLTRG